MDIRNCILYVLFTLAPISNILKNPTETYQATKRGYPQPAKFLATTISSPTESPVKKMKIENNVGSLLISHVQQQHVPTINEKDISDELLHNNLSQQLDSES